MKELILARVSLIKRSRVFDQYRGICSATHSENRIFSHGNGLSGNELKSWSCLKRASPTEEVKGELN